MRVGGVVRVLPVVISVSNCRASLDVATFRGVPRNQALTVLRARTQLLAGSYDQWLARTDAALVGEVLAKRRGLRVGDRFDSQGITVTVAGILSSLEPQDQNVAYVDIDFLQRSPGGGEDGVVTQYQVQVAEASSREQVAQAIDALMAEERDPTTTRAEKDHVARAAGDLLELVAFTRWIGLGCAIAVLGLIGNAIVLTVQARVTDYATMRALGYPSHLITRLVLSEGVILGLAGGALGVGVATSVLRWSNLALSNEGLSITFMPTPAVWCSSLLLALAIGGCASLIPAIQAAQRPLAETLRAE
jgi:putative ABC transport system permease protein